MLFLLLEVYVGIHGFVLAFFFFFFPLKGCFPTTAVKFTLRKLMIAT